MTEVSTPSIGAWGQRYGALFRIAFAKALAQKGKWLNRLFINTVIVLLVFCLWQAVGEDQPWRLPLPLRDLVWYVAVNQSIIMASSSIYIEIEDDIQTSNIICYLLRPFNYAHMRLAEGVGIMLFNHTLFITSGMTLAYLVSGGFPTQAVNLPFLFIVSYLAGFLYLMLQVMIGLTAFWLQDAISFYLVNQKLMFVFGGLFFPLTLYPEWMQKLASFTPWQAILYLPSRLVYMPLTWQMGVQVILVQIFWVAVIYGAQMFLFNRATRQLEVSGG